jgi:primary-amine oxidase
VSTLAPGSGFPTTTAHPLDPLSPAEIDGAVAALRADGRLGPATRFWGATLDEHHARATGERRVTVVALDPEAHAAYEVVVGLGDDAGEPAWTAVDSRRPGITSDESRLAAAACRENAAFRAALAKRGIDDPSLVMIDAESIGGFEPTQYAGRRLAWGSVWHRTEEADNGYARPVQGVVPIIDLERMEVLEVEDHGVLPLPSESGTYRSGDWGPDRTDLAPLDIVQPAGASFTVDGWEVRWQKWRFRVGFTFREGLVLYDVAYEDGDEVRSILKRAAVNEMYVPYLDDSSTQYRKNFFDWGEYGAGQLTSSLALGCDCLGLIHYFDVAFLGADGSARGIPNAICMHEEDFGTLYKHHNSRTGESEVRRSRRMVISSFVTVANYDYGFYWMLYQDGTIELEIRMTGILSASGIGDGEVPAYGRLVGPNVQTPNHQHYFALRLDAAIDGDRSRLVEVHAEPERDPARNPYGNAVRTVRTTFATESEAARDADPSRAVHWRIESAERTNRYGEPTAYRMHIDTTTRPFFDPGSVAARRAPFVDHHLWATPYDPAERYIAGDYPNQAEPGEEGIHAWRQADRSIDGAALVLWPVVGSHHIPRPEDWPIMPVARGRVRLEPDGFFDRNPALDVPAPERCHDHGCHAGS